MAYGSEAGVTLLVGGNTEFITSANITAAIAMADVYVDIINSSASATIKTQASNEISANILLFGQSNFETRGLKSVGDTNQTESVTARDNINKFVTENIRDLLLNTTSGNRIKARYTYNES